MTITLIFVFILPLSMEEDYTTQLVAQTYNLISVSHRIFWRLVVKVQPQERCGGLVLPCKTILYIFD